MICPICSAENTEFFTNKAGYNIYRCGACRAMFVSPIPDNLKDIYQSQYFIGSETEDVCGYADYKKRGKSMKKIFLKYLKRINKHTSGRSLFDIGTADGHFLDIAKKLGWQASGAEISEYAANAARRNGHFVELCEFVNSASDERFDVITMWDVLEHVQDPDSYVKIISERLNSGGVFAFTTTDCGSVWARLTGRFWHLLIPPEHLSYFSKNSIKILLEKNGFEVMEMDKIGRRSHLPQVLLTLYRWQKLPVWKYLYRFSVANKYLKEIIIPVNLRDNVFVIAKKRAKIALLHNFLDNIGGAEIVDLILARELEADIYTTNIDRDKIEKMGFSSDRIFSIGKIPVNAPFKQEAAYWKFRRLKLKEKYDFYIIAGDWAMPAVINHHPNLWYVYSPNREIWDLYEFTRNNIVPKYGRLIYDFWVRYRRLMSRIDTPQADEIVTISETVRERVKRYVGRESEVIYPPTETSEFRCGEYGDYWLSVNRLISYKRVEMQIEAFKKMPDEKMIIVGSYEQSRHFKKYAAYINNIKPSNVEIISWTDRPKLIDLYANCKGFITTSREEDYGLGPIEAMASGKPVIAPNEGGNRETIIDGITGRLIDDIDADKLVAAIKEVGADPERYREACMTRAKQFDTEVFIKKIKEKISERL